MDEYPARYPPSEEAVAAKLLYVCRVCGRVSTKVYDSPESTSFKPTCENLCCGGTCDPVLPT
jgi:hypothetical protein